MISRNLYKACFSWQNCRFLPKSSFLFQHKDRILLSYSRLIRNPIFVYHASEAVDQGPFIRVLTKIFTPLSQVLGMLYRSQASGVLLCGGRDSTKYFFVIFFFAWLCTLVWCDIPLKFTVFSSAHDRLEVAQIFRFFKSAIFISGSVFIAIFLVIFLPQNKIHQRHSREAEIKRKKTACHRPS